MMKNRLIHYSKKKFELEKRIYDQNDSDFKSKPKGFWVSIEEEYGWKEWCKDNTFALDYLRYQYEVILKKEANILYITDPDQLFEFGKKYPFLRRQWSDATGKSLCSTYELAWEKVVKQYQGIIISPYQWSCRNAFETVWYYGWDCASGCIWDLNAIEELKFIQEETITKETIMREQIINEVNATKQALNDLEETAKKFVEKDKNTCTFFGKLMELKNEIIKKSSESKSTEVKEELNIIVERLEEFFRITGEKQ